MKVLLVDDSADVRASFCGLVGSIPNVELVGCTEDVASALSMSATLCPDLIVLDVEFRNGGSGIDVLRQVTHVRPGLQVVVLSNCSRQALRSQVLAAGASAYFDKACEFRQALDWIAAHAAEPPPAPAKLQP